jgi:hypothetical protein
MQSAQTAQRIMQMVGSAVRCPNALCFRSWHTIQHEKEGPIQLGRELDHRSCDPNWGAMIVVSPWNQRVYYEGLSAHLGWYRRVRNTPAHHGGVCDQYPKLLFYSNLFND